VIIRQGRAGGDDTALAVIDCRFFLHLRFCRSADGHSSRTYLSVNQWIDGFLVDMAQIMLLLQRRIVSTLRGDHLRAMLASPGKVERGSIGELTAGQSILDTTIENLFYEVHS
jgi:hypothetical protein